MTSTQFPVPLAAFTPYGRWFARHDMPELAVWVSDVARRDGGYIASGNAFYRTRETL